MATGRVTPQHQRGRGNPATEHIAVGRQRVFKLRRVRVLGCQAVVRRKHGHAKVVRQASDKVMRDPGVEGVATAVQVQHGGFTVAHLRHKPVATRLTRAGRTYIHVGKGLQQAVHAIKIGPACADVATQAKGVVKLRTHVERAVFHQKRPLRHQGSAQGATHQGAGHNPRGHQQAAQPVRETTLNDDFLHQLLHS